MTLIAHIGHRTDSRVYGNLFSTGKGMVFERWKWVKCNSRDGSPKVSEQLVFTQKNVGDDVWNSFDRLDKSELMQREVMDMQALN